MMSWIAFFRKLNINFTRRYCSHFYLHYSIFSNSFLVHIYHILVHIYPFLPYSIFSNSFLVHIYHILVHIYPFLPYSIFSNLFTTPLCISPISHSSIFISFAYYSILYLFASHYLLLTYSLLTYLHLTYFQLTGPFGEMYFVKAYEIVPEAAHCVWRSAPRPPVYANYVYANYVYNVSWLSQVQITALSITPLLCCNIWASQ